MSVLKTFRHEYKYIIPYEEMLLLRKKLNKILDIDPELKEAVLGDISLIEKTYLNNFVFITS